MRGQTLQKFGFCISLTMQHSLTMGRSLVIEPYVSNIFQIRIVIFGPAKKFGSNSGGEFDNDIFRSSFENVSISIDIAAVESP